MNAPPRPRLHEARDRAGGGLDGFAVLDGVAAIIIAVSTAGVVAYANTAAYDAIRLRRGGLIGASLAQVFGAESDVAQMVERLLAQELTVAEAECQVEGHGYALGVAQVAAAWSHDQTTVVVTITPKGRRSSDGARVQAPPVARTLAHEVRNPLAGIRGAAQLIGKTAPPETRALTDLICAEVDRIRRLTDRIDAFDQSAPLQAAPFNIHAALERVAQLLRQSHPRLNVMTDYDPSLPNVRGDVDQLIQALLNLAKNAAEAAILNKGDAGRVGLATRFRTGARLRAQGGRARALLEVTITDNGPGVAAHMLDRLFEPFTTTKANGAGLGLAVAGRIIADHGGRIDVESTPGATVFRVSLPLDLSQPETRP
jgi:two-component system, NtrC family, nitrogen regulation sensor histidine kinase GlnL